jgi:hypothetical protein
LGIAAQLMARNSPRRRLAAWIARAVTSLPVPLSPRNKMCSPELAIRSTRVRTNAIASDSR